MPRKKKTPSEKKDAVEIGQRLKDARTRRTFNFQPMTRKELAKVSGVALTSIQNYENGDASPNTYALKKLAYALQTYTNWILYGKGKKYVD